MNLYCLHEDRPQYHERKTSLLDQIGSLVPAADKLIWISSYPADFFSQCNPAPHNLLHTSAKATEKSCFWKHYDALSQISASHQPGLVLEDDAVFRPDLIRRCQQLLADFDDPYYYINLEYCSDDVPLYYIGYKMVKMKGTRRTGAYLVSPEAAARLVGLIDKWIAHGQPFHFPADAFVTENYTVAGINTYWSVQPLVYQGSKTGRYSSDLSGRQKTSFHRLYESTQYYFVPFINKVRACFLKKIQQRIEFPVK